MRAGPLLRARRRLAPRVGNGDADGIRLQHVAEMFRLKGGEVHGDLGPRSPSRLAILPNTTHVTLMQRMDIIVPMVNDFLDAGP